MGLFDFVTFDAKDVQAVANGTADRRTMIAVFTSQTCGEACWHAREDVCRCSCGGKNHGCLSHGGERPERTAKIGGERYKLIGVGKHKDLYADACRINREAGYKALDKPSLVTNCDGESSWHQYYYTWCTTDNGAPARLKTASAQQRNWSELAGWKDEREVYLLWERIDMPARPTQLRVDRATGLPLENQNPEHCY